MYVSEERTDFIFTLLATICLIGLLFDPKWGGGSPLKRQ
jgi:hypothetical protein